MGTGEDTGLSRREKERRWHRSLILDAAERLFSSRGYHATSMQEIADTAEFSVGFLYKMFENKEDLYHQLVDKRWREFDEMMQSRIEDAPGPVEKIKAVISAKLLFFRGHRRFFNIFANLCFASAERRPPPFSDECVERYRRYESELEEVFRQGRRQGVFADCDPAMAVLALEGVTNAIVRRWSRPDERRGLVSAETVESILFDGLLATESSPE